MNTIRTNVTYNKKYLCKKWEEDIAKLPVLKILVWKIILYLTVLFWKKTSYPTYSKYPVISEVIGWNKIVIVQTLTAH